MYNHNPESGYVVEKSRIFIVEDDVISLYMMRDTLLELEYDVDIFPSSEDFLAVGRGGGCLVLDIKLPGMSGVELLRRLSMTPDAPLVIVVSGSSGIADAVQVMKLGAFDFIEKPVHPGDLLDGVKRALEESVRRTAERRRQMLAAEQLASLTRRQRQIMEQVLAGRRNKQIAADLGVSQRTVENHRAAMMAKLGASSVAALSLTVMSALTSA